MDVINFIKDKLGTLKRKAPKDEQVYVLNSIYARLEYEGYKDSEIKLLIDEVLIQKMESLGNSLKNLIK